MLRVSKVLHISRKHVNGILFLAQATVLYAVSLSKSVPIVVLLEVKEVIGKMMIDICCVK